MPPEDIAFALEHYFPGVTLEPKPVSQYEYYAQRNEIIRLFGYRLWAETDRLPFVELAMQLTRRDVTPTYILIELLAHLETGKIVRPGYTTLQTIISDALTTERHRLALLVGAALDENTRTGLHIQVTWQKTSDRQD